MSRRRAKKQPQPPSAYVILRNAQYPGETMRVLRQQENIVAILKRIGYKECEEEIK